MRQTTDSASPVTSRSWLDPSVLTRKAGFPAFLGQWTVRRRIVDRLAGSVRLFSGVACVEPERFAEEGELDTGSDRLLSRRTYRLDWTGDRLSVRLPSGADFIALGPDARQTVRHACGADIYLGRFFFRGRHHWGECWHVIGPRKNYVSLAHYRRMGPTEGEPAGRSIPPRR